MLILERTHHSSTTILEYFITVDVNQVSILNRNQSQYFNVYNDSLICLPLTTIGELL